MNKVTTEEIIQFLKQETYEGKITSESDVFREIGICGDDCDELLHSFQEKYKVDMKEYLWYFHQEEEGSWNNIGSSFFKSPNERVKRIPITPKILTDFANSKKWKIDYPEHKLPKNRYDLYINWLILIFLVATIILVTYYYKPIL